MGRNRRIPFGYKMENGEITTDSREIYAVVKIFNKYIAGNSLTAIATMIADDGIPYYKGETPIWNKNMIKRMIENKKYLGDETYPQIIDKKVFEKANAEKTSKANNIMFVPERFNKIRNMIVCAECGKRLFRNPDETWNCKAPACRVFSYTVTDQMIESAVLNMLNTAIANPSLIEAEGEISIYTPNGSVMRQRNEINRLMDQNSIDYEKVKKAMIQLAQLKYKCCTYNDIPQKTEIIKSELMGHEQLNELDTDLITKTVCKITISHYATIGMEMINGVKLTNITEKGEQDDE